MLSSEERLERASANLLSETERRVLFRRPVQSIEQMRWTTGDVPLVDEAQALLFGPPSRYWHVVVDETRDLTPMELRMCPTHATNARLPNHRRAAHRTPTVFAVHSCRPGATSAAPTAGPTATCTSSGSTRRTADSRRGRSTPNPITILRTFPDVFGDALRQLAAGS